MASRKNSKCAIVLTTVTSKIEARKLSKGLLNKQLIACSNILGPLESHFVWKGKAQCGREYLMILKTMENRFHLVKEFILQHHSYDVPEVLMISVQDGAAPYLRWVERCVRGEGAQ